MDATFSAWEVGELDEEDLESNDEKENETEDNKDFTFEDSDENLFGGIWF